MSLDTYANLKLEIADWLDRSDLTDQIDTFIDLAEARHKREIRFREILTRATLSISDGDRYVSLPADFLDIKFLRILIPDAGTAGRRYYPDLEQKSIADLTDLSVNDERRPMAYSIHAQIEFDSEADQDYTGEIFYYIEMTALSDGNTSNELLAKAPDCYLYGALAATSPFLMNDERLVVWENLYRQARDSLNESEIQNRHAGPMISRVPNIPRRAFQ